MQQERPTGEFNIEEARRVLGDVFAPWVQDLGLSVERVECAAPPDAAADWQPGAILRMAFSERLCRSGGIVCGQALMALADTSMVFAILRGEPRLSADDRPSIKPRISCAPSRIGRAGDARVVRLGRTMSFGRVTLSRRSRPQAGGDCIERFCDAVRNAPRDAARRADCNASS
jgi:hypothetical protein